MLISYDLFCDIFNESTKSGEDFYVKLLKKLIRKPKTFCGYFQSVDSKTRIIQNLAQSQSIKFGNFLENITKEYLKAFGFDILDGKISTSRKQYECDQLFKKGKKVYLVEQKIRDNHDSTKKDGQVENFESKIEELKVKYPRCELICGMWFVDDDYTSHKPFYQEIIDKLINKGYDAHLWYGGDFFKYLKHINAWKEFLSYLKQHKKKNKTISIPDFDKSNDVLKALISLSDNMWNKLVSNKIEYVDLRKELFPNNRNLKKAKEQRKAKKGGKK